MKKIEIFDGLSFLQSMWPVTAFEQAYPIDMTPSLRGYTALTMGSPDKMSLITFRTFIENGELAKEDQKYIIGIRFYNNGDMATVDLISLSKGWHKEIGYEHLKRLGWLMFEENKNESVDHFQKTQNVPFIFVGGHLKVSRDNELMLFGSSGDYGNDFLFSKGNDIAAYVAQLCGINIEGDTSVGKSFVENFLDIMLKHKLKDNFYELFIDEIRERNSTPTAFSGQDIGALISMKALDRAVSERISFLQAHVDEMSGGLARYFMLTAVVARIKSDNKIEDD